MPLLPQINLADWRKRLAEEELLGGAPPSASSYDLMGELSAARRPPELPNLPPSSAPPMSAAGSAGGVSGPQIINRPPSRYEELQEAKDAYLQKTPGRFKSGLLGALRGLAGGLASGGGLGAGLGGLAAGAAFGGINPRGQREQQFNEQVAPKIGQRWQFEDADRAQRAAEAKAASDAAMNRMQMSNIQSQINSRAAGDQLSQDKFDFESGQPLIVQPEATALDRRTGKPIFTAPARSRQPSSAELTIDPESGMSFEEMADASYQGRGGDRWVYDRLPERTRRVLESKPGDVDPAEVRAAQQEYQSAINRQRNTDLDYTRGAIRSKVLRGGQGRQSSPTSSAPAQSRPRTGRPGRTAISVSEAADLLREAPAEGGRPAPTNQQPPQAEQRPGKAEARANLQKLGGAATQAASLYQAALHGDRDRYYGPVDNWIDSAIDKANNLIGSEDRGTRQARLKREAEDAQLAYERAYAAFQQQYGNERKK